MKWEAWLPPSEKEPVKMSGRQMQPTLHGRLKPVGSHAKVHAACSPPGSQGSQRRGPTAQPRAQPPGSTAPGRTLPRHHTAQPLLLHEEGALLPDSSDSSVNEPARGGDIPAAPGAGNYVPTKVNPFSRAASRQRHSSARSLMNLCSARSRKSARPTGPAPRKSIGDDGATSALPDLAHLSAEG